MTVPPLSTAVLATVLNSLGHYKNSTMDWSNVPFDAEWVILEMLFAVTVYWRVSRNVEWDVKSELDESSACLFVGHQEEGVRSAGNGGVGIRASRAVKRTFPQSPNDTQASPDERRSAACTLQTL